VNAPVSLHAHLRLAPSYRLFVMLWGGLAAIDVGHLLGAPPLVLLTVVTAVTAGCCVRTSRTTAIGVAAVGWLLVNGFVVNELGDLRLTGVGDLLDGVLLLGVALAMTRVRR
jgi:hypothetical protein